MRFLLLLLITGCSCESISKRQLVRQYSGEKIEVQKKMCKKSYVFLSKCEVITETRTQSAESGQDLKEND